MRLDFSCEKSALRNPAKKLHKRTKQAIEHTRVLAVRFFLFKYNFKIIINSKNKFMKASTMSILDKRNPEAELFGVKIQVNNRRSVYVSKNGENHLLCVPTKKEAQIEADLVNDYISKNPEFETKLNSDKSIKVVIF